MDRAHWDEAYGRLGESGVSWYRGDAGPTPSLLDLLPAPPRSVVDVGGGASVVVDALLARGIPDVAVVDLSPDAMQMSRERLGASAARVEWIVADLRDWTPRRTWDVWHDRAVFHFMVTEDDRAAYSRALRAAVPVGGHVIVATFAPEGPERCSRLPVVRYGTDDLVQALDADLTLVAARAEVHVTPSGTAQPFTWVLARRS